MLTVGSLFSGIGGIDLGLERAGFKIEWQIEIDPWCQKVLTKHWPNIERFSDVRECGKENLKPVDLICGGFPCQDVSLAGKRAGLRGKRTTLWSEFARIISEIRPRWVLVENVPGLLSSDSGQFFGNILRDLAACRYDAEWDCIPAAAVGAPHRRDRVWIVAYPQYTTNKTKRRECAISEEEGLEWGDNRTGSETDVEWKKPIRESGEDKGDISYPASRRETTIEQSRPICCTEQVCEDVADTTSHDDDGCICEKGRTSLKPRDSSRRVFTNAPWGTWAVEPPVGRVVDGLPSRVHRLRGLGNAVVPQVVEWIGRQIIKAT